MNARKVRRSSDRLVTGSREQLTTVIRDAVDSLRSLRETLSESPVLFPFGISKISMSVKAGGVEFAVDIEGPKASHVADRLRELTTTADLVFEISERVGRKARGTVMWDTRGLSSRAVSGDSTHDAINVGTWKGIAFQERAGDDPYCDPSGNCWFSVFQDAFGRTGIGLHPDGGVPDATLGCIGLRDRDTTKWHDGLREVNGQITCEVKETTHVRILEDDGIQERIR